MSLVNVWHPVKMQPDWEKRYLTEYQTRYWRDPNAQNKLLFIPSREAQTPIRDIIPLANDAILGTHWNWSTFSWRVFENRGVSALSPKGVGANVYCTAVTPHKPCLIQGLSDGKIAFIALKPPFEHVPFYVIHSKAKSIFRLAVSPDDRFLLATDNAEHVFRYLLKLDFLDSPNIAPQQWRGMTPVEELAEMKVKMAVQWLAFTSDSRYFIASSHESKKLVLCETSAGKIVRERKLEDCLGGVAVMPNGNYFAADSESAITFWELPSMNQLDSIEYKGWLSSCTCLALSPNGRHLVTPSSDMLTVWNLETGKSVGEIQTKPSHDDFGPQSKYPSPKEPVQTVAFLPDGKHLVTGGEMGGLNLWDLSQFIR